MKLRIKYPNLTMMGASTLFSIALTYLDFFEKFFGAMGDFGYLGAFVAGILFPITFTSPIAAFAFYYLGGHYNIFLITSIGALGAVIGDLIIFTFIKGGIIMEIEKIREEHKIAHPVHGHRQRHEAFVKLFHSKPFHALALFVGGLMILLPGPDEFGIAILASYKFNMKRFVPISLVLNTVSIYLVALAGK